nr:integrase, catalytic region, zinc finger, CCHC-type, peptidase aspartic, catalytic [Tanacetum cinerariifolium]
MVKKRITPDALIDEESRKIKGNDIDDNAAQVSNATTIALGVYKLDLVTLAYKDKNNRETHMYYLKHTMEQAAILREIVEQAKSQKPLDSVSYSAYKKPDLSYLHVFGALCYPKNNSEDLGKLQAKGPELQSMTLARSSSGLVANAIPQRPCNPLPRDDWDHLFQPMFDEYFNPLTIVVSSVPIANAPRAVDLADSLVSMSNDQDVSSTSIPSTKDQENSLIISQGFKDSPKTPHFHDDPLHESLHEDLTSQGSSSNVRPIHTPFESLSRWTKDHPISNVIIDPSRSISTRKQL